MAEVQTRGPVGERRAQRAVTRQRLLDATRRIVGERGYHGASVSRISRAAGVTTGAIYDHFDNKWDLVAATYEEAPASRLMVLSNDQDLRTTVAAFADQQTRALQDMSPSDRAVMTFQLQMALMAPLDDEVGRMARAFTARRVAELTDLIETTVGRTGEVLNTSADALAMQVFAMTRGFLLTALIDFAPALGDALPTAVRALVGAHVASRSGSEADR